MPLPINYRRSNENVIASYNYIDVVTGMGQIILYGGDYKVGSTKTYTLTSVPFYSATGETQTISTSSIDLDFDIKLGRTITTEGIAFVNIPFRISSPAGESVTSTVLLRKWDGTTETELVSGTATDVTATASVQSYCQTLKLLMPKTILKTGQTFRLTLQVTGVTGKTIQWLHDPKNRSTINGSANGTETSMLTVTLPIIIKDL